MMLHKKLISNPKVTLASGKLIGDRSFSLHMHNTELQFQAT